MLKSLSEEYPSFVIREAVEKEGWDDIATDNNIRGVVDAYINKVIWAKYWNARVALENSGNNPELLSLIMGRRVSEEYKLDIDVYTKHWLYAHIDDVGADILSAIHDIYGYAPVRSKYLLDGADFYSGF